MRIPCSRVLITLHASLYAILLACARWRGPRITYPHSSGATQLSLQTILKLSGVSNHIGVVEVHDAGDAEEDSNEGANHDQAGAGGGPGVLPGGEDAQQIVILVDGLAKVSSLLGIPPVAVGVTELSLDCGRVDVATVLRYYPSALRLFPSTIGQLTMPGSSASLSWTGSGYFSSIVFLSVYE